MYQIFYYSYCLFILLITQFPILVITQQTLYVSKSPSGFITTTLMSSLSYGDDESVYETDNSDEDIYDDRDSQNENSRSASISQSKFNKNLTGDTNPNEYDDETSSHVDEDEDDEENGIYPGTMSVNRLQQKPSVNDSNNKNPVSTSSTSRMAFAPADLWRDLLSKPAVLIGVIGGIVIGMLTAILLIMFIIYRMRKRDEGSYVLDEGPRKSPSHAYTRVSSREFFA